MKIEEISMVFSYLEVIDNLCKSCFGEVGRGEMPESRNIETIATDPTRLRGESNSEDVSSQ